MSKVFERARQFMLGNARLLERRLFEARFEGANPSAVGQAVRAYRNADGGLGHALEPDIRCAESQPIFAGIGLEAMEEAGCRDEELAMELCGFLVSIAAENGMLPALLDSAFRSPIAAHWLHSPQKPGLNPTANLCGLLHYQGVRHEWLERATDACVREALASPPPEAHSLRCVLRLAEHIPDRAAAGKLLDAVGRALPEARFFIPHAPVDSYGLTPLHFAPGPDSFGRQLFTGEQIAGHLEDLLAKQQTDGGWPIYWEAPGRAAEMEWRGRWTLDAISCLSAYGAI